MTASFRQRRRIRAVRERSALRGIVVVMGHSTIVAGASPVRRRSYWSRRLGIDHSLGSYVRVILPRPVPR